MEMKYQPVTEDKIIAFISESMDPFEADSPAATQSTSPEIKDDEDDGLLYEYVSEEEVALENGCWIDDDGQWVPMDDNELDW